MTTLHTYRPGDDDKPRGRERAVLRYLTEVAYPAMLEAGIEPSRALELAAAGCIDRINHQYAEQARRVLARRRS